MIKTRRTNQFLTEKTGKKKKRAFDNQKSEGGKKSLDKKRDFCRKKLESKRKVIQPNT